MNMPTALATLSSRDQAAAVLHPLRLSILREANEPRSAAAIAERLDLPRQRVNYHVRALADAGLLRRAGRRKKRNMTEQRYVATARAYVISPEVLGALQVDERTVTDAVSAGKLLALGSRLVGELSRATREAAEKDKRIATLSIDAPLRFDSAAQRDRFARALRDAVTRVVAEHASPMTPPDGDDGAGRPFRLVVGCYPIPPEDSRHDRREEDHDE